MVLTSVRVHIQTKSLWPGATNRAREPIYSAFPYTTLHFTKLLIALIFYDEWWLKLGALYENKIIGNWRLLAETVLDEVWENIFLTSLSLNYLDRGVPCGQYSEFLRELAPRPKSPVKSGQPVTHKLEPRLPFLQKLLHKDTNIILSTNSRLYILLTEYLWKRTFGLNIK
jgi:hypothetical protein